MDWGVLEDEGMLTNAPLSVQEPPSSRAEGSESTRLAEVGAEESAASRGVPVEDRWVAGFEEAPEVLMEEGGLVAVSHERTEVSGSTTQPEVLTERGGSTAVPSEMREMSSPAREQGAGSKRSCPDESGQGSGGSSPKQSHRPKASG